MQIRDDFGTTLRNDLCDRNRGGQGFAEDVRVPSLNEVVKDTRVPAGSCQSGGYLQTGSTWLAIFHKFAGLRIGEWSQLDLSHRGSVNDRVHAVRTRRKEQHDAVDRVLVDGRKQELRKCLFVAIVRFELGVICSIDDDE